MKRINKFVKTLFTAATLFVLCPSLILLLGTQKAVVAQTTEPATAGSLSVSSGRPLAEMLDKIQHLYVVPVNFEEAPYESPLDLKTVPVAQDNGSTTGFRTVPITGFSVTLGQPQPSIYNAIQSVLSSYAHANLPGVYTIVQDQDQLSVVPQRVRAASGSMLNVTPVMSAAVQFPMATRTVVDTLELVVQNIFTATGAKVILLNTPFHLTDTVTMSATGQPAREVIANLGKIFGVPMSSQCVFDATDKTYYLNIRSIFAPNPAGVPQVSKPRAPIAPGSSTPNPKLFTKQ